MSTRARGWRNYPRFDPDRRAEKLKGQYDFGSKRPFAKRLSWRRHFDLPMLGLLFILALVVGFILYRWVWNSNLWPNNQERLSRTYIRDCADARRFGIVPLYSGNVGYRESLDLDRDEIACEPFPF